MDALSRTALLARKAGMSYGQYVGLRFEKNGYKPVPGPEPILEVGQESDEYSTCEICGKLFLKRDRNNRAKTCSDRCSLERKRKVVRERYREEHKNDPIKTANCIICGKKFAKRNSRNITCSEGCSLIRKRQLVRLRYGEYEGDDV